MSLYIWHKLEQNNSFLNQPRDEGIMVEVVIS
jgi:hypothetical protein